MSEEEKERRFLELVRRLNSELLPYDEDVIIAVYNALREAYGLAPDPIPILEKEANNATESVTKGVII